MRHTSEAERAIIGACVLRPEAIRDVTEHVTPDDFLDTTLGRIYALILGLHTAGLPCDPISIEAAARDRKIRGVTVVDLMDLAHATPTTANVDYWARVVHAEALARRVVAFGLRTAQLGDSDGDINDVMATVTEEFNALRAPASGALSASILGDVLATPTEYDWVLPDLLERRDRLILTGGEGGGKTTLLRQIAIAAAAGVHPFRHTPAEPRRVLVVDAENTRKQWARKAAGIAAVARNQGSVDPTRTLALVPVDDMPAGRLDLTTERDRGSVHRLIDDHKPDIVMIGPLYKLMPRAIQTDDDAAPLISALDGLRARDVALLMEAHAGHATGPGGERDLRPRGSSALMGWPEFGMGIAVDRERFVVGQMPTDFKLVRWRGDRDEREWPSTLLRGASAWPWTDENHRQWRPGNALH